MVKTETRQDDEILVRNPSPGLFGTEFQDSKKVKTNHARSCQNFLSPMFFEIPFATPNVLIITKTKMTLI